MSNPASKLLQVLKEIKNPTNAQAQAKQIWVTTLDVDPNMTSERAMMISGVWKEKGVAV